MLRHPRSRRSERSSACPRSAWRSRRAPAGRSGCRGSSGSARAKELILTGRGHRRRRGRADRPRQRVVPAGRGRRAAARDRRRDRRARAARRARGQAPDRPRRPSSTSTPASRPRSRRRTAIFATEDMLEGARAFFEKREPRVPRPMTAARSEDRSHERRRPIRGLPALVRLGGRRPRARPRHQGVRATRSRSSASTRCSSPTTCSRPSGSTRSTGSSRCRRSRSRPA